MEYNTSRGDLSMREYGRHIQKMVNYLLTIEDRAKRQEQANLLIDFMGILNPHLKNIEDFKHKLWDHLFFMSNFKLDVESPYPIPQKELYKAKPAPLPYPKNTPRYAHLGKNLETLLEKALKETNKEKQEGLANTIAYYMKLSYSNWHKELISDAAIQSELDTLSKGVLQFDNTPFVKLTPENRNNNKGKNKNRQNFSGKNNNTANKRNKNRNNKNFSRNY